MSNPVESAEKTVQDAHLWDYVHVVLRRKWLVLAIFLSFTAHASIKTMLTRPVFQATAQLLIEREAPSVLTFKEVSAVNAGFWGDDYYQTQYKLLQSRALARRVIESLELLQDAEFGGPRPKAEAEAMLRAPEGRSPSMEGAISALQGRLNIQAVKNSRLVTVSVEGFRPELAAQIANTLTQLYIEQTLEFRYTTSAEAGQWLGQQTEEQRKKVETAEIALQALREREGIVNIEERRTLLDQKLRELGTALTTLKTERLEKEALYRQMRATENPEELPDVMRNPLVQSLRIELSGLERQQAQFLERYLEAHPEVVKVKNQIAEAQRKITAEAERIVRAAGNDYKAVAAQEASVSAALEATKAEVLDLSRRSVPYDSVRREVDAGRQVLNSLLERHKQTDVAQELKSSNIRIVDRAVVPQGPIRPQKRRDILMGMLLGIAFGLGLAFFLDYLDDTIKTPDDVRHHLGVPLLGVVPEARDETGPLVRDKTQGPFVEGYRVARTALNYSWPDHAPRAMVVTSTSPGEGKTLTSSNLAFTLASMEDDVLLIDADLRKPQVHDLLSGNRAPGLSDVLVGQVSLEAALQSVPGSRLSFLSAGTHAPSPADLMTNRAMRGLIESLKRSYRWVIIDTPPVGAVADALVLASLADGVIVVAGAEMVPRKAVLQTLERIGETGTRILGLILNRAQIEKNAYYYSHYYGHYYGSYPSPGKVAKVARIDGKRAAR